MDSSVTAHTKNYQLERYLINGRCLTCIKSVLAVLGVEPKLGGVYIHWFHDALFLVEGESGVANGSCN